MIFQPENKWDRLDKELRRLSQSVLSNGNGKPDTNISSEEVSTLLRRQYGTDKGFQETFVGKVVVRRALANPEEATRRIVVQSAEPTETAASCLSCYDKLEIARGMFQGYSFAAGLKTRRDARFLERRKKRLARKHKIGIKAYTAIRDRFIVAMKGGA